MYLMLLMAIIIGINRGFEEIIQTRNGTLTGTKPSNSLLEFIFLNK